MAKKIGCKKCESHNYSFVKIVKKHKVKYYRNCNDCGKSIRVYPKRLAFHMYFELFKYEAAKQCQGLTANQEYAKTLFKTEDRLKKEYSYLYNNLILFFDYIFYNEIIEKIKKVAPANIIEIMKKYKSPLVAQDYEVLIGELLKTIKTE